MRSRRPSRPRAHEHSEPRSLLQNTPTIAPPLYLHSSSCVDPSPDQSSWIPRRVPLATHRRETCREQDSRSKVRDSRGHADHAIALALPLMSESVTAAGRRRNNLYMVGTKISVANVANSKPPITALPNGAFCSPPSPIPKAIGTMPRIIAPAVISTGRSRVYPAL